MSADSGKAPDNWLSPETSPTTMEIKTAKARRINNWPMFILMAVGLLVFIILGMVMISRGNRARAEVARAAQAGRSAVAQMREVTDMMGGEGGVVRPPEQPQSEGKEALPESPKAEPEGKANLPPPGIAPESRIPPQPRLTDEAKKVRDRRFRMMEQAIDGPIQVRIDENRREARSIDGEMERLERQIAALNGQEVQTYEQRLAAIRAAAGGDGDAVDYSNRGDLPRMKQFAGEAGWTNPSAVEAPPAMHIIRTGSVIPATLVGGINSDLPGQIIGQVSQNVYDTPTGKHLLIPQGSRLVGEYSSQVQYGQSRVFAVWQRIVFPDGKALDLGEMPGSSGAGYAGFRDRVNNHYIRIFGSAIMMSAILAGVEMTQNDQGYAQVTNQQRMSDALSEALGNQLGGVMAEMLQKNMNIAPTLEIRPGYRFNVMLVKDLVFGGSYRAFDYAAK